MGRVAWAESLRIPGLSSTQIQCRAGQCVAQIERIVKMYVVFGLRDTASEHILDPNAWVTLSLSPLPCPLHNATQARFLGTSRAHKNTAQAKRRVRREGVKQGQKFGTTAWRSALS